MSEMDLWDAYHRSRDRAARNDLVVYYQPLVRSIARNVANGLPRHIEFEDLLAMGFVGLIEAVERFNPDYGHCFATFATWRVRGAMLDGMRSLDGASRAQRRQARELSQIAETLSQMQKRTVNMDEAAQFFGTVGCVPPAMQTVSWEELATELPIMFAREERIEIELLLGDKKLLTASERSTLYLSYFADYSLAEIGALLGVTESRVCQVRKSALAKLRTALERGERQNACR
jgi:RNA polymerase sigma factor for flagellar operon FliA